jgi:hypothetical protein
MSSIQFSLVSVSVSINYDVNVLLLLPARSISISRRLLVSLASFPFSTLGSWFLARFFSGGFTNVHDTTTRLDSFFASPFRVLRHIRRFRFPPHQSDSIIGYIPNSITNVQIKRDSVDRCSPLLRVWISLHNTHTYTYTYNVYEETV